MVSAAAYTRCFVVDNKLQLKRKLKKRNFQKDFLAVYPIQQQFTITGNTGGINLPNPDKLCVTDYVIVPGGSYVDDTGSTIQGDRFCGLTFPSAVTCECMSPNLA